MLCMITHRTTFNTIEEQGALIIMRRTATAYDHVQQVVDEAERLVALFPADGRGSRVILRDLRAVRGNGDPAIDSARNEYNGQFFRGWRHVIALLETEVGRLHAQRAFCCDGRRSAVLLHCTCWNGARYEIL